MQIKRIGTVIGLSLERGSYPLNRRRRLRKKKGSLIREMRGMRAMKRPKKPHQLATLLPFSHHLHHPNPIPMTILILVGPVPQAKRLMVLLFSSHLPLSS